MRASRLLLILTTLQAKGRATAQDLATACEVSLRTIYRDIDALSAAGVPVYAERGQEGGYRLLDGYRTRLNGLSRQEAEALFLTGLPEPAAMLGLGAVLAAAELKLLAALPAELRASAEIMRSRFLLDAPAWFADLERPAALAQIAEAIWSRRAIEIRYRSWKAEADRRVEPLGIVLKNALWYMVARASDQIHSYRISRILSLRRLDQTFAPPADFDLAAYWQAYARRFEASLYTDHARVRLSPRGLKMLGALGRASVKAANDSASAPDKAGWREVTLPIESIDKAAWEFLRLGGEAEVLAPNALRERLRGFAHALHQLYEPAGKRDRVDT